MKMTCLRSSLEQAMLTSSLLMNLERTNGFLNHLASVMTMEMRLSQGQNHARSLLIPAWAGWSIHQNPFYLRSLITKLLDLVLVVFLWTVSRPHLRTQHSGSSMKDVSVSMLLGKHDFLLQTLIICMRLLPVTPYFLTLLPMMMDSTAMVAVKWCSFLLEQQAI